MQKNKILILALTFQICFGSPDIPLAEVTKLASNVSGEVAKTVLSESIETISGVGTFIKLAVNVYDIGKNTKSYFAPSKEEQVRAENIDKQLKLIELKRNLRLCLIKNKESVQKGSFGIPSECEEIALFLSTMGAWDEVNRMIHVMKKFDN